MTSMLTPGRVRRSARTALALGAATCALAALSACDKPGPVATVTVGANSVHSEPACYEGGKQLSEKQLAACAKNTEKKSISYGQGDTLRFGVDPEVAEHGWQVFLGGQPLTSPSTKTYVTYELPQELQIDQMPAKADLVIAQTGGSGGSKKDEDGFYRLWHFSLDKDA